MSRRILQTLYKMVDNKDDLTKNCTSCSNNNNASLLANKVFVFTL